jgi:hypothetical protein
MATFAAFDEGTPGTPYSTPAPDVPQTFVVFDEGTPGTPYSTPAPDVPQTFAMFDEGVLGRAHFMGPFTTVDVEAAECLALDLIVIEFEKALKNEAALQSVSSYTVNNDAIVTAVYADPSADAVLRVYLTMQGLAIGTTYTVTVAGAIFAPSDEPLSRSNHTVRCVGRSTKIDRILTSQPRLYNKNQRSVLRGVISAIGREDDLIGGDRNDTLPSVTS